MRNQWQKSGVSKAVNRGDKRTRRVRDRDFVKFERSRRYRDRYRYRCQEKKSRRGRARDLVLKVGTGTGTVINYGSGPGTRHKIMYLIYFNKHFFHLQFTINLLKFMNFFLVKQLTK